LTDRAAGRPATPVGGQLDAVTDLVLGRVALDGKDA
jgi:hypothetical protein